MKAIPIACFAAFVLGTSAVAAQKATVYRWTDASGGVHYGDTPPQGRQAARIGVDGSRGDVPSPASSTATATGTPKPPSTLVRAETAARTRNCESARANMRTLDDSRAILVDATDPNEPRRLSDVELATQRRAAQADIDTYCGGAAK